MGKTAFLIDLKKTQTSSFDVTLAVPAQKPIILQETSLSFVINSVIEYCRVVWDLYPYGEVQMNIVSARKIPHKHFPTWSTINSVSSEKLLESFTGEKLSKNSSLSMALQTVVPLFAEPLQDNDVNLIRKRNKLPPHSNVNRLICFLMPQSQQQQQLQQSQQQDVCTYEGDPKIGAPFRIDQFVEKILLSHIPLHGQTEPLELTIIQCVDDRQKASPFKIILNGRTLTPNSPVKCNLISVGYSYLTMLMRALMTQQYGIRQLIIQDVPMRYNTLIPSASANQATHLFTTIDNHSNQTDLILKWKSVNDVGGISHSNTCTCVHFVTPVGPTSKASSGLISHILSDRSVCLSLTSNQDQNVIDFMLVAHGGIVYLHCLSNTIASVVKEIPSLSAYTAIPLEQLRLKEFVSDLIDRNMLFLGRTQRDESETNRKLRNQTRFWPMLKTESILFDDSKHTQDFTALLTPILKTTPQSIMAADELETCIALITKFRQLAQSNDGRLFPYQLGEKEREQLYLKSFSELYEYVKLFAHLSSNHEKLIATFEKLWPDIQKQTQQANNNNNHNNSHNNSTTTSNTSSSSHNPGVGDRFLKDALGNKTNAKSGVLYANLTKNENEQKDQNDVWSQRRLAEKQVEEQKWKQADQSQKPVQEFLKEQNNQQNQNQNQHQQPTYRPRKRRKANIEISLESADKSSLFYQYWSQLLTKKIPPEFDARKEQ